MSGKNLRLARLFGSATGKAVIIPVDHGEVMGSVEGLTNPYKILHELVNLQIDGVLMGPGLSKITDDLFTSKNAPARVLTSDYPLFSCIPGRPRAIMDNELLAGVEFALMHDFVAIKTMLSWGLDAEFQMKNIKLVATLAEECDRWGIPLMVEPVLLGKNMDAESKNDPELVAHATRIAMELGADILKIQYTGDPKGFADLVACMRLPVVVLGGPKMGSTRDILQVAKETVGAGARGIVFGRNVWQNPMMSGLVNALKDVVHNSFGVDEAMKRHEIAD